MLFLAHVVAASASELSSIIKYGADQIFKFQDSTVTDEDIESILARGQAKTNELNSKLQKIAGTNLDRFSLGDEAGSLYQWDGVDYSKEEVSLGLFLVFLSP